MLRGWVHPGFSVHCGRRVLVLDLDDMERLAQYIIRTPFSVDRPQGTRVLAVIDEEQLVGRMLHHLGRWEEGVQVHPDTDP